MLIGWGPQFHKKYYVQEPVCILLSKCKRSQLHIKDNDNNDRRYFDRSHEAFPKRYPVTHHILVAFLRKWHEVCRSKGYLFLLVGTIINIIIDCIFLRCITWSTNNFYVFNEYGNTQYRFLYPYRQYINFLLCIISYKHRLCTIIIIPSGVYSTKTTTHFMSEIIHKEAYLFVWE